MAIDEVQPDEAGAKLVSSQEPKARRALSRLKRELTDEELSSPGVQKLLLDSLERAEEENTDLKSFRDRYYDSDKQRGILGEKLKTHIALDVVSTGCIAVGAAAIVYAPVAWEHQPNGEIALGFGIVMTIVGTIAKLVRP
jgi:hypothetical protein